MDTVIHAAPVRGSSTEEAGSVMCVIRRCESAAISNDAVPTIVFRLDCNFNILCEFYYMNRSIKFEWSPKSRLTPGTAHIHSLEDVYKRRGIKMYIYVYE